MPPRTKQSTPEAAPSKAALAAVLKFLTKPRGGSTRELRDVLAKFPETSTNEGATRALLELFRTEQLGPRDREGIAGLVGLLCNTGALRSERPEDRRIETAGATTVAALLARVAEDGDETDVFPGYSADLDRLVVIAYAADPAPFEAIRGDLEGSARLGLELVRARFGEAVAKPARGPLLQAIAAWRSPSLMAPNRGPFLALDHVFPTRPAREGRFKEIYDGTPLALALASPAEWAKVARSRVEELLANHEEPPTWLLRAIDDAALFARAVIELGGGYATSSIPGATASLFDHRCDLGKLTAVARKRRAELGSEGGPLLALIIACGLVAQRRPIPDELPLSADLVAGWRWTQYGEPEWVLAQRQYLVEQYLRAYRALGERRCHALVEAALASDDLVEATLVAAAFPTPALITRITARWPALPDDPPADLRALLAPRTTVKRAKRSA